MLPGLHQNRNASVWIMQHCIGFIGLFVSNYIYIVYVVKAGINGMDSESRTCLLVAPKGEVVMV